jgi:hypothetical protein
MSGRVLDRMDAGDHTAFLLAGSAAAYECRRRVLAETSMSSA